jgi:hypothetical protein
MRRTTLACAVGCLLLFSTAVTAEGATTSSHLWSGYGPILSKSFPGARAQFSSKPRAKSTKRRTTKPKAKTTKAKKRTKAKNPTQAKAQIAAATPPLSGPAVLGDQQVETTVDDNTAGSTEAFPFTSIATGKASVAHVYLDALSRATHLMVGLYSYKNGKPGTLLTTGTLSSPTAGAWNTVQLRPITVTQGTGYALAIMGTGGTLYFRDRSDGSCTAQASTQTNLRSMPSSWSTGTTWKTCPVSASVAAAAARTTTTTTSSGLLPIPPVDALAPSVSGTTTAGDALTTTNGTWVTDLSTTYTYQWQDCDTYGTTCVNIPGATGQTYTLTSTDVGQTIRSVVTATDSGGSASASSGATATVAAPPPPPAPTNTAAPAISGTAQQGQILDASNGTWTNNPAIFGYQWEDCNTSGASCTTVSGATSVNYTLAASDVGHTVRVVVTATNAGGSNSASSGQTATVASPPRPAPTNTAAPAISGTAQQGSTLNISDGTWTNNPTSFAYKWEDCNTSGASCTAISGATSVNYTLAAGDVGHTIRVVVSASNAGGSGSATSSQTATVSASTPPAPTNTAAPAISGTAQQGSTLSTSNGSWTNSPTSWSYQWEDCNTSGASCANISGATTSSYTLGAGDVGDTVRVVVTVHNAGGSTSASSAQTATVAVPSGGGGTSTQVGAPGPAVSCTRTLGVGSNVETALQNASPGDVVCLAAGNWSDPNLSGIAPSSNITLAAAPGATVNLASLTIGGPGVSKNLTVQGFHIGGVSDITGTPGGLVFQYNTLENLPQNFAFYFYADGSGNGFTQTGVKILYNQMDYVGDCLTVAGGEGMEANFTFSHNVCGPHIADGDSTSSQPSHYIEIGGVSGVNAEDNAFEGPMDSNYINAQLHNNVFHVFGDSDNVDFSNNILWHTESRAQTILIQEGSFSNVTVNNNLMVEDPGCFQNVNCYTESMEIYAPHGMTASNNTVINSGLGLRYGETCSNGCNASGNNMTLENNIGGPVSGQAENFAIWDCASACTTDHNVSADGSAPGASSTMNWAGSWQTTMWTPNSGSPWSAPPAGYYKPSGLAATEGYQGTIGP